MTEIPPLAKDDPLKSRSTDQIQDKLVSQALLYLEQRLNIFNNIKYYFCQMFS